MNSFSVSQSSSTDDTLPVTMTTSKRLTTPNYEQNSQEILAIFSKWNEHEQLLFAENLIKQMQSHQHGQINAFLLPMLQRDFLGCLAFRGLQHVAEKVLGYLDDQSLRSTELVCRDWYHIIAEGMLWKKLIEQKYLSNILWRGLTDRRGWTKYLFRQLNNNDEKPKRHDFYRRLYPEILRDIDQLDRNWRTGNCQIEKIQCRSQTSKGVYCLQYDDEKIVSGLRDNTIKIWDRKTLECLHVLTGHTGSVLCLQYDDEIIVTGSSDSTVRVWNVKTGELINTLSHHCEAVLHLRFSNGTMVTCSKDRSIAVWQMNSPTDITIRRVLVGHRAAVNVVDFDDKYIVSASGDRTIKVWDTASCEFVRTLLGHKRGIACLQYRDKIVVSGSSDNTIRVWDIECGACLRILEGHDELVRCIRFDSKRIVSGAYDGKIKIWDLQAALDPRAPASSLCLWTLNEHTGRVFRLQFDEFQIVSSSHDDTILCFNFLQQEPKDQRTNLSSSSSWSTLSSPILVSQNGNPNFFSSRDYVNVQPASIYLQTQASVQSAASSSSSSA